MNKNEHLMLLLSEQFGVISRIDHNSEFNIKKSFFFKFKYQKAIDKKRLIALKMSKEMAHACRMVMWYMSGKASKDEAKKELLKVLHTNFDHDYSVSAKWNINAMYHLLNDDREQAI